MPDLVPGTEQDLLVDSLVSSPTAPATPAKAGWEVGLAGIRSAAQGLTGFGARVIGAPAAEATALQQAQAEQEAVAPLTRKVEDVSGVGEAFDFAKYGIATALPSMLLMFAGGAAGRVAGSLIARRLAAEATKNLVKQGGMVGGAAASSLGLEVGSIFPEAVEEGVGSPVARSLAGGAAAAALDVLPGAYIANRLGLLSAAQRATRKAGFGAIARGAAGEAATTAVFEGVTEAAQEAIESVAAGKPIDASQLLNAGVIGALGGGTVGGAAGVFSTAARPIEQPAVAPAPAVPAAAPATPVAPVVEQPLADENQPLPTIYETEDIMPPPDMIAPETFREGQVGPIVSPQEGYQRTRSPVAEDADLARQTFLTTRQEQLTGQIAALEAEKAVKGKTARPKSQIIQEQRAAQAELGTIGPELGTLENTIRNRRAILATPETVGARHESGRGLPLLPESIDTTPAETAIAQAKRAHGLLVSSREARLAPIGEAPALAIPESRTPARERVPQPDAQTRRETIEGVAVESIKRNTNELAQAGGFRKGTALRAKNAIIDAAVEAAQAPTLEQAQTQVHAAVIKALGGNVNKQDAETFAAAVAKDIAKAPAFYRKGAVGPQVEYVHWGDVPTGQLDPTKMGTGVRGADWPSAQRAGIQYISAVVKGVDYTERAVQSRTRYEGTLAPDKVYIARGSDPLLAAQRQYGRSEEDAWAYYMKAVRDQGYDAMLFGGGHLRIFTPQAVTAVPAPNPLAVTGVILNIGLKVGETGSITEQEVLAALNALGTPALQSAVHTSNTEQTVVAILHRDLTPDEAYALAVTLQQQAIVQVVNGEGALYGPNAAAWGAFQPGEFIMLDGRKLSEIKAQWKGAVSEFEQEMEARGARLISRLEQLIGKDPGLEVKLFISKPAETDSVGAYVRTSPLKSVIALALNAKPELSIADHEGFHYLEDQKLDPHERAVIKRGLAAGTPMYKQLIERAQAYDRAMRTNLADEIAANPAEARAYAFEFWRRGEMQADTMLARVFRKLHEILQRIVNMVSGLGFKSIEDVFRAIDAGAMAGRARHGGSSLYELSSVASTGPQQTLGSPAWQEATKPQGLRAPFENLFGGEEAPKPVLSSMEASVLPVLHYDQVRQAVIAAIPVNVVDVLTEHGFAAEQVLSNPAVVFETLPVDARSTVGTGIRTALAKIGTRLRAALNALLPTGRDGELLPTLLARDLHASEIVGLLAPVRVSNALADPEIVGRTGAAAETSLPPGNIARESSEPSAARLAELLNRHDEIVHGYPRGSSKSFQPGFDLTPELSREAVRGLPLFSKGADQTKTPEFKKWFGGSKVVDAKGEPLVVYHGTNAEFSRFRAPAFFSDRPGPTRKEVLREKKFLGEMTGRKISTKEAEEQVTTFGLRYAASFAQGEGGRIMPVFLKINNPVELGTEIIDLPYDSTWVRAQIRAGHDGAVGEDFTGQPIYVPFRPNQIKSVFNRGTFDPNDPNILHSRAAAVTPEILQQFRAGELPLEQQRQVVAGLLDETNLPDPTLKQAGWLLGREAIGSFRRWTFENITTGNYTARFSKGYKNVMQALSAYSHRKQTLISEGSLVGLSEWHKGALQADITAVGRVLLQRTDRGLLVGSPELNTLLAPLTEPQKRMYDQAVAMIAGRLQHEFEVEKRTMAQLLPAAEYAKWEVDRATQVAKLQAEGYVPERRYGDHAVHIYRDIIGQDGKPQRLDLVYEQYEHQSTAEAQVARYSEVLAREAPDLKVEYSYKYKADRDTTISIQQFLDTARRHGVVITQAEKERLAKALVAADSIRRNRLFRRKNIPGYSEDIMRVLHEFVVTTSNKIAYAEFSDAINDAIQGRPVDARIEQGVVRDSTDESRNLWKDDGAQAGYFQGLSDKLVDYVLVPDHTGTWSKTLRGATMMYFLGGSFAAGAVNVMSVPMNTIPWLSQSTSYPNAFAKTLAAWKDTMANPQALRDLPTLKDPNVAIPAIDNVPGLRKALIAAAEDGRTLDTEIHQIMGISQGSMYAKSRRVQKAIQTWMLPFRFAEQTNRIATFIAAYKIGQENRLTGRALYEFSAEAVDNTQNRYDEVNRPGLARHPVWALMFMFKSFPLFTLEMLHTMYRQSPKSAVFMLLGLVAMTGVNGLPFAELLLDMIDTISQRLFGSPFNARRAMHNVMKDASEAMVGVDLSEVFLRGTINAVTGMNIASRIGLGDFVPGTRIGAADNNYKRTAEQLLGAPLSMVADVFGSVGTLAKGDLYGALREGGPSAGRNILKAYEQMDKGFAVDARGQKLVDVTGPEALWQALGFSSASLAKAYDMDRIDKQQSAFYKQVQSDFTKELVQAALAGDSARMSEVYDAVRSWNEANPEMPIGLSAGTIRRQMVLAGLPLNQRTQLTLPRALRGTSLAAENQ